MRCSCLASRSRDVVVGIGSMAPNCKELLSRGPVASRKAATRLKAEAPLKAAARFVALTVFDSGCQAQMLRGV